MRVFEVDDLQDGYVKIVNAVLAEGQRIAPRGIPTVELCPATIVLRDPARAVPVGVGRAPRLAIGAAESCQLVGGFSDARQMVRITDNFAPFVEGDRFRGAYGPRIHAQVPRVIRLLREDPDTRQAGLVIWRPWDLARPSKDVPCTVELHYFIRAGRLHARTLMRSNDVFWGLPYDAWMFANLQHAIAYALAVEVGTYTHVANSLHAYVERDLAKLKTLHDYDGEPVPPMLVPTARVREDSDERAEQRWDRVVRWAEIAAGIRDVETSLHASAAWYQEQLRAVRSGNILCPSCRYVLPKTREHFWRGHDTPSGVRTCRRCGLLGKHELSPEAYDELLLAQDYRCAICRRDAELIVDHDHATDRTRGLLCRSCNVALGLLADDPPRLTAARHYLENGGTKRG